jgi:RNA polymerase sigma-70 factor (ECF subfamily)
MWECSMLVSAWDQAAFGARMEPYRRALHVHCYRMLGSLQDADDMVQETFLRAWRRRDAVEGLDSLKSWLYTIATNVCLDALRQRPRRLVPAVRGPASTLAEPIPGAIAEPIWLGPYPDARLLAADEQTPEEQVAAREHVAMAFMVALHQLPPRQRAVLLLRDVLDWPASEVAALLDTTVSAVKATLHRARATLADRRPASDADHGAMFGSTAHAQLAAYVRAWEAADIPALVRLLKEDATYSMPPIPAWYRGRETIRALLSRTVFSGKAQGRWRLLPARANGQAAFGLYRHAEIPGLYRAYGIQLVTLCDRSIGDVITFMDAALLARFDLPTTLSAVPA